MAGRDQDPSWWTNEHTSAWDRIKEALRRDWEQTKADFSRSRGRDLHQGAVDTLRQALGRKPIPPPDQPNPPDIDPVLARQQGEWERLSPAIRYGYGAANHYVGRPWDEALERELQAEWIALKTSLPWEEVSELVRRGWEIRRREPR
jgi:hypothetical protein